MKEFKGRVIAGGEWKGEAVVSRQGVNTLATFQKSALKNAKRVIVSDQNNADIYGKDITGKALCLPITIGSTTGGLVIQTVCAMKIAPAAFLFSEHIDSLAASGIVLARIWEDQRRHSDRYARRRFPFLRKHGRQDRDPLRRHGRRGVTNS